MHSIGMSAKSSGKATRRRQENGAFHQTPSRQIALPFINRTPDTKVSLLADYKGICQELSPTFVRSCVFCSPLDRATREEMIDIPVCIHEESKLIFCGVHYLTVSVYTKTTIHLCQCQQIVVNYCCKGTAAHLHDYDVTILLVLTFVVLLFSQ